MATTPLEPSRKLVHTCVLERPRVSVCAGVSVWFPTNQCLESALWLTNQVAAARSGAFEDSSLVGFLCRASPAGSASLPSRCPWLSSTPPCWSLLMHSLSSQRLPLLSLGAQLILETTRGYCWRLVFLGL